MSHRISTDPILSKRFRACSDRRIASIKRLTLIHALPSRRVIEAIRPQRFVKVDFVGEYNQNTPSLELHKDEGRAKQAFIFPWHFC